MERRQRYLTYLCHLTFAATSAAAAAAAATASASGGSVTLWVCTMERVKNVFGFFCWSFRS